MSTNFHINQKLTSSAVLYKQCKQQGSTQDITESSTKSVYGASEEQLASSVCTSACQLKNDGQSSASVGAYGS